MFIWLTLRLLPYTDSFDLLSTKGMENGILAILGVAFILPNVRKTCQLRASYSLVTEVEMDEACQRIAPGALKSSYPRPEC